MSILRVLTELTSLSPNGIVILKPFRAWFGNPTWRTRKVGFRILNGDEIEQALEYVNNSSVTAQEQALKKEIVTRALWSVDEKNIVSKEELEDYNVAHKSELSDVEYKRIYVGAFEQYLIDYLHTIYTKLQQKQVRRVYGVLGCEVCEQTYPETSLPVGTQRIKFSYAEIVCPACLPKVADTDRFDFDGEPTQEKVVETVEQPVEVPSAEKAEQPAVRLRTDFPTEEEFRNYMIEQAELHEKQGT